MRTKYTIITEFFSPDLGGRICMPINDGYSPHACTKNKTEYLPVVINKVPDLARFNTKFSAEIEFLYPEELDYSVLISEKVFYLFEGSKKVAECTIT